MSKAVSPRVFAALEWLGNYGTLDRMPDESGVSEYEVEAGQLMADSAFFDSLTAVDAALVASRALGYVNSESGFHTITPSGVALVSQGDPNIITPENAWKKFAEDLFKRSERPEDRAFDAFKKVGRATGLMTGAYHGYKRSGGSIWSALGWGIGGALFWPVTIPVSLAQGFGKPKKKR